MIDLRTIPSVRPLAVCWLSVAVAMASAGEPIDPVRGTPDPDAKLVWYDLKLLEVEGRGWTDTKAEYDRLPAKAEGVVREPVWALSRQSAGMCVRFVTDARTLHARWTLNSGRLAMPNMPATGVSGLDLYVKHEGRWRWLAVGIPSAIANRVKLVDELPAGEREFLLYLPLRNGVVSVEMGIPASAKIAKGTPYPAGRKPILFYGTSITHGGSASRPGMVHTSIVGRHLNYPVINLGFGGNGRMEPELAELLAELDPAAYVLDCLPNMMAPEVTERVEPFVSTLRRSHPDTPILLVEDRTYADSFLVADKRQRNVESRAALRAAFNRLMKAKTPHIYYLRGEELLGDDGEATVDSSHPTDLGFTRQAAAFETALKPVLGRERNTKDAP